MNEQFFNYKFSVPDVFSPLVGPVYTQEDPYSIIRNFEHLSSSTHQSGGGLESPGNAEFAI